MSKLKKIGLTVIASMSLALQLPVVASAMEAPETPETLTSQGQLEITPFLINLEVQYQTKEGIKYKRRWNRYNGTWYDRYWVRIEQAFPGP